MKGGTSPVSEADYAVDRFLRETLLAARPDYGWLSEETADSAGAACRAPHLRRRPDRRHARLSRRPLDLVRQRRGGRGRASACRRARMPGDAARPIWATAGEGACKDGRRLQVGAPREPARIGGPKPMIDAACRVSAAAAVERAPYVPSLAYRIAMVADGALDATFVKPNAHDWDLAAADLILREAGGTLAASRAATRPRLRHRRIRAMARWRRAAASCLRQWSRAIAGDRRCDTA